jgi:hypothetical protein
VPIVRSCKLPANALLHRYCGSGAYADCYVAEVTGCVSQAEFVEAFYTTCVFKLERLILRLMVSRPSTDMEAKQLANGTTDSFAAWRVESRTPDQLLMSEFTGRTRSWFMAVGSASAHPLNTRLFFGSAVVPTRSAKTGRTSLGPVFSALIGFHKLYSWILLRAAAARLARLAQQAG